MKRGLILNNAYMTLEHYLYQSRRLSEELALLGVETDIRRNDFFPVGIDADGSLAPKLPSYDFCVYLDKDKYVSYLLEGSGLRLFNTAQAIELCDDKMTTAIALADNGIPMPLTFPGLLCFDPTTEIPESLYRQVEALLGYPFVLKTSYGSLGKGVYKIDDRPSFVEHAEMVKCQPHLYQRYVAEAAGHDIRVIMVGNEVVAAMERRSNGDFRSNLELGGTATPYDVPPALAALCRKIVEILQLDYCGIDLLPTEGGFLLCEVNSNAFFGGMERTTGCNVAKKYAEYIKRQVYHA